MIYLDTHVVVWLYAGLTEKLSKKAISLIENNDIYISPAVKLELCFLQEIKRINSSAQDMIRFLQAQIGLNICDTPFETIVNKALSMTWTRDPFDRLIAATSACSHAKLITKDETIRKHNKLAVWE
jgi:PIN domain nuclease of toxin-antitoxin system